MTGLQKNVALVGKITSGIQFSTQFLSLFSQRKMFPLISAGTGLINDSLLLSQKGNDHPKSFSNILSLITTMSNFSPLITSHLPLTNERMLKGLFYTQGMLHAVDAVNSLRHHDPWTTQKLFSDLSAIMFQYRAYQSSFGDEGDEHHSVDAMFGHTFYGTRKTHPLLEKTHQKLLRLVENEARFQNLKKVPWGIYLRGEIPDIERKFAVTSRKTQTVLFNLRFMEQQKRASMPLTFLNIGGHEFTHQLQQVLDTELKRSHGPYFTMLQETVFLKMFGYGLLDQDDEYQKLLLLKDLNPELNLGNLRTFLPRAYRSFSAKADVHEGTLLLDRDLKNPKFREYLQKLPFPTPQTLERLRRF